MSIPYPMNAGVRVGHRPHEERGAGLLEYSLLVALIAMVVMGAVHGIGIFLGGLDNEEAHQALGGDPVTVDENTASGPSAGNGAGGQSGAFGEAAEDISQTGLQGGFESDHSVGGYWNTHRAGSFVGDWEVVSGSVDARVNDRGPFDLAIEGQFMDLNGTTGGHIRRDVSVIPETPYNLSIDLGENVFGGPAVKQMEVIWNGQVISTLNVDLPNNELRTFTVQVPESATSDAKLEFRSLHGSAHGVLLDNPTLTLVPR